MTTFNAKAKAEYGGLLPPFDFTQRVKAQRGLQDKIQMLFELGRVSGEISAFCHYLGLPPREHQQDAYEAHGRIFNRQQAHHPYYKPMSVRKIPLRWGTRELAPPSFSGALQFQGEPHSPKFLKAKLSLNPTKFLRRLGLPSRSQHPPSGYLRRFRLTPPPQPVNFDDREFPFMQCDNWLPNTRSWRLATTAPAWQGLLESYISGVHRAIARDIRRAAEYAHCTLSRPDRNRFVVWRVETYWEFFSHDPLADMGRLAPLLEETFAANRKDYPVEDGRREPKASPCFTYCTRTGEWLKIYAKTNRRIRVEVTHFLSGKDRFQKIAGYFFDEIDGVLELLRTLADYAAEQVNEFFATLERKADFGHHKSPMQLLSDIAHACDGDAEKAQMILNLLVFQTGIDKGRGAIVPAYLKAELQRLVQNGILDNAKRFTISGPYRASLEFLRESENECSLRGRIRRRRSRYLPEP